MARLQEKLEVFQTFTELLTWIKLQMGQTLKVLRTDGGGEYTNMPQHNSIVEQLNRTLLEKAHAMLNNVELPDAYWFNTLEYTMTL